MKSTAKELPPLVLAEDQRSDRYLSLSERQRIATLRERGLSMREIGRRLGRHVSTIGHELRRNTLAHDGRIYTAASTTRIPLMPERRSDPAVVDLVAC